MYPNLVRAAGAGLNTTAQNVFEVISGFSGLWKQAVTEIANLTPASPAQKQALILLSMA